MNIFNRYKKPTWDLMLEVLEEAYDEEEILDYELEGLFDDIYEDLLTEIEELAQSENRAKSKNELYDVPNVRKAINDFCNGTGVIWFMFMNNAIQRIGDGMVRTYRTTAERTYSMFAPTIGQYQAKIPQLHMPDQSQIKVQIRDTNIWDRNIKIPWCSDGKVYSDRLWSKVSRWQDKLNYVLTTGVKKGALSADPKQKAAAMNWMNWAFKKLSHATAYEVARLIQTETMAMWSMATKESYLNMGIEYVEIINDSPCEEECSDLVGEVIPLRDAELGNELPPYHPNCKCEYIAYTEYEDGTTEEILGDFG